MFLFQAQLMQIIIIIIVFQFQKVLLGTLKIILVKFADDSFMNTIPKNVFELSSIRSLHLPESSTY